MSELPSSRSVPHAIRCDEQHECELDAEEFSRCHITEAASYEQRYKKKLLLPNYFCGIIIGRQGSNIKKLQREFSCRILVIPADDDEYSLVRIETSDERNVNKVCQRIEELISIARSRAKPTHFVCLPVLCPNLQSIFRSFRHQVLLRSNADSSSDFRNVTDSIFIDSNALHFTICPLLLVSRMDFDRARELLEHYFRTPQTLNVFSNGALYLTIEGLGYFGSGPDSARVLYAKIAPSLGLTRLQHMASTLIKLLTENKLIGGRMYQPDGDVRLHMTLMNAKFAKNSTSKHSFSAVGLLRDFDGFLFGRDVQFDELRLCLMSGEIESSDFSYPTCFRIQLNRNDRMTVEPL